jgi:bifunctional UDP-N-acetylglucosamine pyrophosphorylase/glucosamine-1-phosphate N-acetyltransferase
MDDGTNHERVAIILAAGEGKRMKSPLPKVLHPVGGRPMVLQVVETARASGFTRCIVVVGHGREEVTRTIGGSGVEFAVQAEQLGTGHAVEMAAPLLDGYPGHVSVLCGDVPLLTVRTLSDLIRLHEREGYAATVLTFRPPDPTGYGRIYRDARGDLERIVEQRDLPSGSPPPGEVNSGTYCFSWPKLRPTLKELRTDNQQGEYYLTDTVELLRRAGHRTGAFLTQDAMEVAGVNTPEQLRVLDEEYSRRRGASS